MADPESDGLIGLLGFSDPARRLDPTSIEWRTRKERTFAHVIAPARPLWFKRRSILVPLIFAMALGGAAAAYSLTRPITAPTSVGCYSSASLSSTVYITSPDGSPESACRAFWSTRSGGPSPSEPLVTCVASSGGPLVFPSRETGLCAELGLADPEPSDLTENVKVATLSSNLGADNVLAQCWSPALATSSIASELYALDLEGWSTITIGTFSAEQPCAGVFVDASARVIELIPQAQIPNS